MADMAALSSSPRNGAGVVRNVASVWRCRGHHGAPLDGPGVTGPEDTQAGGARDLQASRPCWNCGEVGSIPLPGPNTDPLPFGFGLGKFGTPWDRMHSAKATVTPEVDLVPDDGPAPAVEG